MIKKKSTAASPAPAIEHTGVPPEVIEHLKIREGWRVKVYLDSLGKPTAGLGHLLSSSENKIYKVGERVPGEILEQWAQKDATKAYGAAVEQASVLRIGRQPFINALASVNFQLGISWFKIHKQTWAYMLDQDWERAALEIEDSLWFKQTPVRVRDFQKALRGLRDTAEYEFAIGEPAGNGVVDATSLNIRTGPGIQYPKTGNPLTNKKRVVLYGKVGEWFCIGEGQWVSAHYIITE